MRFRIEAHHTVKVWQEWELDAPTFAEAEGKARKLWKPYPETKADHEQMSAVTRNVRFTISKQE